VDLPWIWVSVPGTFALMFPFSSLVITAGPAGTNLDVNVGAPLGSRKRCIFLMNSPQPFEVKFSCACFRDPTTSFSVTELDASRGVFCAATWQQRVAIESAAKIFIQLDCTLCNSAGKCRTRLPRWQTHCQQRKLRCFHINSSAL
jgi:hypothetical protein